MTPSITESTIKLADLVAKVDTFVNGGPTDIVQTTSGGVKTLAGISKQVSQLQYVTQCFDYNTMGAMLADVGGLDIGQIARVLYDPQVENNGIYQMQELTGLVRINYADIYDLNDRVPDPYNNLVIPVVNLSTNTNILVGSIPVSSSEFAMSSFDLVMELTSDVNPLALLSRYSVKIAARSSGEYGMNSGLVDSATVFGTASTNPSIAVFHVIEGPLHKFTVQLKVGSNIPVKGRVICKGIDLTVFRRT